MSNIKQTILAAIFTLCGVTSAQAQKIQVVDESGQGIGLASVTDGNGVLIGLTDINGVLADVKGNQTVAITHVAYKPKTVAVASLSGGRVTMEVNDFGLDELVVKPKPLLYTELYYRFYAYVDDSLRTFVAGIVPYTWNFQKKKQTAKFSDYACAVFNLKDVSWWKVRSESLVKGALRSNPAEKNLSNGSWKKELFIEQVPLGENRWAIVNPVDTVGTLVRANGMSTFTVDGAKVQMYANEQKGQTKMLKRRQEKNYAYEYVEVFRINDDGEVGSEDYVMSLNHWEHDGGKGRETYIVEAWVTDRGYMTDDEFKQKRKDIDALSSTQAYNHMPLEELEAYERKHNIPAISSEVRKAVALITRDRWTKK
ncbi:MAG: hypothetical protein IKI19_08630 [Prevotella sp.]|nr:hypothetical protein [Prevotella sp.]MBR6998847.1 hypothetical protein [Prevotella sp.]